MSRRNHMNIQIRAIFIKKKIKDKHAKNIQNTEIYITICNTELKNT